MVFQKQRVTDPKLPFFLFVHRKNLATHKGSLQNWHENIELLFFTEGQGLVSVDESRLSVKAGEVAVINADRIHRGEPVGEEDLRYYVLIVDRSFCLQNYFDTNLLCFESHFKDEAMTALMEQFVHWQGRAEDTPFRVQNMRSSVLAMLSRLCTYHCLSEGVPPDDTPGTARIKRAIELINAQYHRDISLAEIADFAGLSKYYFSAEFHRITGYSFVDYLNTVRCENAKSLLSATADTIDDIGTGCGFAGRSYFTRVFAKYTGVTPAAYRKLHRK